MKQFVSNVVLGKPWSAAVMSAIELAVKAAWPERDTNTGMTSGSRPGAAPFYALRSTVEDWTQLDPERQDQILAAIGSAAGRLYGLIRPNSDAGPATIVVGIEAADPLTTRTGSSCERARENISRAKW